MAKSFDAAFRGLLQAAAVAARAHHGQLRKDGKTPYISHPFRVCLIVRDLFGFDDPRMLQAALLHDVLEDTTTDFDDLAEDFGVEVATWAALLSKDKRKPEAERERDYLRVLVTAPWQVQACKLADMMDNLHDSAHLFAERRTHSVARIAAYFTALQASVAPELQGPLSLVEQALRDAQSGASRTP